MVLIIGLSIDFLALLVDLNCERICYWSDMKLSFGLLIKILTLLFDLDLLSGWIYSVSKVSRSTLFDVQTLHKELRLFFEDFWCIMIWEQDMFKTFENKVWFDDDIFGSRVWNYEYDCFLGTLISLSIWISFLCSELVPVNSKTFDDRDCIAHV